MPLYLCSQAASKKRRGLSPADSGLPVLVEEDDVLRRLGKADHVVAKAGDLGAERWLILCRVHVLGFVGPARPSLQLAAPDPAEVHVVLAVAVLEDRRVDAVAPLDGLGPRRKGTGRAASNRGPDAEGVLFVFHGKVQVVAAVLLGGVGGPHLPARPRDVLDVERDAVVGHRASDRVHRKHVIVAHGEMAAEIVGANAGVDVVRRIDEDLAVEDVRGWVGGVEVLDEGLRQELRRVGLWRLPGSEGSGYGHE